MYFTWIGTPYKKLQIEQAANIKINVRLVFSPDKISQFRTYSGSHRLNMELDHQSLFGLRMLSCTHWLRPRNRNPIPRIWAHIRGRYWSAKIDDISL